MHCRSILLPLLAGIVLALPAASQDFFSPGLRWTHASPASESWIPDQVRFAGRETQIWALMDGQRPHLALLDAVAAGDQNARAGDERLAGALGAAQVAAGERTDALYALAQYPDPLAHQRRTEITRHNPIAQARGAAFAPVWSHDMGWRVNAPAHLATDAAGEFVFAVLCNDQTGQLRLDVLDGEDGSLLARRDLLAAGLDGLCVSAAGNRIAVASTDGLFIFDERADLVDHLNVGANIHGLAFSADGSRLLVGVEGAVGVWDAGPAGYSRSHEYTRGAQWLPVRVAMDAAGHTLALAWWHSELQLEAHLDVIDGVSLSQLWQKHFPSTGGSLQNLPAGLEVNATGERIALGLWGNGAEGPELMLFNRTSAVPVFSVDLPGSVRDLDLDASGTRMLVAYKDTHNSLFGITGGVRMYDTGERDLQLTETPVIGGQLSAVARHPGTSFALFLLGPRAPEPIAISGVVGLLHLQRSSLSAYARAADAEGIASYQTDIPASAGLIGLTIPMQAAFRVSRQLYLSTSVVDGVVLDQ